MELTGRTLGQYRVLEEISRGGMGVVYRATDSRLNRDVALKVLPAELTHDADRRRRFLQEAQAASSLEHPHIAVIHEAGETDGVAYIAMELIRGEKMSDLLARERPLPSRALELAAEIAAGLARAHEKGIIHRDLKPSNVMVTDEGHAKVIDFGIAKLIETAAEAGAPTKTSHDTGPGVVLGTTTYMSPEQARGGVLDARSDIFSFGIVLHEMLAGQPPFRGKTSIETASAILHEPAPRLPPLGPAVIAEAGHDIQRIVDKCLAKDPADRYQWMKDLVVDLRAARRRLETGPQTVVMAPATRAPVWAWAAGALVIIAVAGALIFMPGRSAAPAPAEGDSTKPSVAVLYFDNTTGDQSIDWMRTGITEMVVTDLSQSQDIEVIGTDRLYGILAELRRQDDRVVTPEVISAVAERTGVDRVLVGSYVKAGEAIRINVRLQDAKTGRIESSDRVEGANAAALFSMVDELTARIRTTFAGLRAGAALLTGPGSTTADRSVGDVTTSSIEAYRLYAQANDLHTRARYVEALPLFERALAIDPSFAMAHAKAAVIEGNLGHFDRRNLHAAQALKLADRLTPRERFYIEGYFYSANGAAGKAIDAYQRCLAVDPAHQACRINLALMLMQGDRVQEGIAHYEQLLRMGDANATAVSNLVLGYIGVGEVEKAQRTAETFLKQHPEMARAHVTLAAARLGAGRFNEALSAINQARALGATDATPSLALALIQLLAEDFSGAEGTAARLLASSDETARYFGAITNWIGTILRGRSGDSVTWAERAAAAYKANPARTAAAHLRAGQALLARGETALAVQSAEKAVAAARGGSAEPDALVLRAHLFATAGRVAEADAAIGALAALGSPEAERRNRRDTALARGLAALGRGDAAAALPLLNDANAAMLPRNGNVYAASPHVLVWSSIGRALLQTGKPAEALPWFRKASESGVEHLSFPDEFVRSFYYLGRIYEQQGDMTKARESYARFVNYWKDGDLDRDRVAEARKKVSN